MDDVTEYKYLGCWIKEFGNNKKTVEALTSATGRSYGRIVANYAAGVWGFKVYSAPRVLQRRVNRFYLGVHRYAANAATSIEMDVTDIRYCRWLEILRYYNCIYGLK